MKGKKYTTEDKIRLLRAVDGGKTIQEVCREHNISEVSFHRWKRQFGQMDVALELGIPCVGWCPKGRRAEDGRIADKYPLEETPAANYQQRTEWNVRDSDGTLILTIGPVTGGTKLTVEFAHKHKRPCLVVDLLIAVSGGAVREWIAINQIRILNVAGPRASKNPEIYGMAVEFLKKVFMLVKQ